MKEVDFHIFQVNSDTLLALPGGEVFLLDDIARDLINSSAKTINEAKKRLSGRYAGPEITKAFEEIKTIFARPVKDHRNDSPCRKLRALCLNVTHKCNLACTYCFARDLTRDQAISMPVSIAKKALEFLAKESGDINRLQVDFFGGEPLLAKETVFNAVEHARSIEKATQKKFLFTLTTNAVLLDEEIVEFVKSNRMSLILSLDGRELVNDLHRRGRRDACAPRGGASGGGSFESVIKNIRMAKSCLRSDDYYIRGTFTSENLDILDTLRFYDEEGFGNVSLEPVSARDSASYSIKTEHLERLMKSYQDAAAWMLGKKMKFFHFNLETENPLCLTRRITGCGAGVEYLAVDPLGDLYPCHQFIGQDSFRMGNVISGIGEEDVAKIFKKSTIYSKEGCDVCWARFYCGGGCHFQQYLASGDISKPSRLHCDIFMGRLEVALWYNAMKELKDSPAKHERR
jgi:uncharacterized protein